MEEVKKKRTGVGHFGRLPLVLLRKMVATRSFQGSWKSVSCTRWCGERGGVHFLKAFLLGGLRAIHTHTHTNGMQLYFNKQIQSLSIKHAAALLVLPVITVSGGLPVEVGARFPFVIAALGL